MHSPRSVIEYVGVKWPFDKMLTSYTSKQDIKLGLFYLVKVPSKLGLLWELYIRAIDSPNLVTSPSCDPPSPVSSWGPLSRGFLEGPASIVEAPNAPARCG